MKKLGDSLRMISKDDEALKNLNSALSIDSNHDKSLACKGTKIIKF